MASTDYVSPSLPAGLTRPSLAGQIQWRLQNVWLWVLVHVRPPMHMTQVLLYTLYAYIAAFVTKWAAVWALLAVLAPDSLLPSEGAVGTIAEILPALMVSIFVFILGSFFVVNQQATHIHSNRASLLLLYDSQLHHAVARPLIISVATLAMALLIPDGASAGIAALALVLVLATGFTLVGAATLLPYLITRVTAPRNFALYATEDVDDLLEVGATGLVAYRVGLLGEMLRRGVRNGDSLQVSQALQALTRFHDYYLEASVKNPEARIQYSDDGQDSRTGWLGGEMVPFIVSAGQEAIGADTANEDVNEISRTLAGIASRSAEAGHREEYERAVDGLAELGTCTQQLRVPGLTNVYAEPAWGLAAQVVPALEHLDEDAAARALALWALVITYDVQHLGTPGNVHWERSLREWPPETPWDAAHEEIDREAFRNHWANKLAALRPVFDDEDNDEPELVVPGGSDAVHLCLAGAQQARDELL